MLSSCQVTRFHIKMLDQNRFTFVQSSQVQQDDPPQQIRTCPSLQFFYVNHPSCSSTKPHLEPNLKGHETDITPAPDKGPRIPLNAPVGHYLI